MWEARDTDMGYQLGTRFCNQTGGRACRGHYLRCYPLDTKHREAHNGSNYSGQPGKVVKDIEKIGERDNAISTSRRCRCLALARSMLVRSRAGRGGGCDSLAGKKMGDASVTASGVSARRSASRHRYRRSWSRCPCRSVVWKASSGQPRTRIFGSNFGCRRPPHGTASTRVLVTAALRVSSPTSPWLRRSKLPDMRCPEPMPATSPR